MPPKTESASSDARHGAFRGTWALSLILIHLLTARIPGRSEEFTHAGPVFDKYTLTLNPGQRTEAAGPFFYSDEQESEQTWALPPFLSVTHLPEVDGQEIDFAYPVMTYHRYGGQYRWQFFQILSFAGGPAQGETARNRFTLFPFYFQQRSSDPNQNYTAYGPFYGHLRNRLFRDEIRYIMFPAYSQTRKADIVTDNYFYPLYHQRHGDGLAGWQLWPFLGHEHKDVTTHTNGFNDVETVPGHDSRFALWPIYSSHHAGIGSENPEWTESFIPAFSRTRSPLRDSTTVLWPFFSHIQDHAKKFSEWDAPWPLIEFARGEGKYTTRVWPFYSHAANSNQISDFCLWPVYKFNRTHADPLDRKTTRICFFLYSDVSDRDTENSRYRRRVSFWPLFVWHRDFAGKRRLQALALLEPFLPENQHIEKEYAPVYSLWRSENNPKTGVSSQSVLWNVWHRQTTPTSTQFSAFFGLYQYRADPEGKQVRLFFIPWSSHSAARNTKS